MTFDPSDGHRQRELALARKQMKAAQDRMINIACGINMPRQPSTSMVAILVNTKGRVEHGKKAW